MINFYYKEGQTPINEDEKSALIPYLNTISELNEWEQGNIIECEKWLLNQNFAKFEIFNEKFLKKIHQKMFDKTWRWAGQFRKTNKNIGCDFHQIAIELKKLNDDVKFWLQNQIYKIEELALVYHHRLVKIHLFSNGNGRHARKIADIILKKHDKKPILWLNENLFSENEIRKKYIQSLKNADKADYQQLFSLFLS